MSSVRKALVVDDCIDNTKLLAINLKKMGYLVTQINDGQEAVESCIREAYDLILMDIHMPFLNGMESVKMIRLEYGMNTNTPIIAITADFDEALKRKGLENGFDAWVNKPISFKAIEKALCKIKLA